MRKLFVLVSLTVFLLAGCQQTAESGSSGAATPKAAESAPAPQVQLTPGLVQPGVGAGGVKLGQSRAEVEKVLGTPSEVSPNEYVAGQVFCLHQDKGVELVYQDDELAAMHLHAKQENWPNGFNGAVEEGVGPGSSAGEILERLGQPDESKPQALLYSKKGLIFRLNRASDSTEGSWATTVSVQAPEL